MDEVQGVKNIELQGVPLRHVVLALGADMKNAVAVGYGRHVAMSPSLGALDSLDVIERFEQVVLKFSQFPGNHPDTIAVDLHPDMQSSRYGRKLARDRTLRLVEVQHHQAHAVACLAENGYRDGLALVMDGTGWGGDGTIWGAELLDITSDGTFRRFASFAPVPLPGGDAAVRHPARQGVARWVQSGVSLTDQRLLTLGVTREEAEVWEQQCRRRINAPLTHAAGRLFDAFSVLLGLAPRDITVEGEPAIRLEAAAREWREGDLPVLPFDVRMEGTMMLIDWAPAFRMLADVPGTRQDYGRWAMAVHVAVARAAVVMIEFGLSHQAGGRIALSGGVFLNRILNELMDQHLVRLGITALRHVQTLPGDECIALGQAVVAGQM